MIRKFDEDNFKPYNLNNLPVEFRIICENEYGMK